jgi:adenylosuccinate lyase
MRLMAGYELVTEGFKEGQVGSSAMPHKMNTRSSERVWSLAEMIKMYADGASRLSGSQWEEGDVSCSALRRIIIPDSCYASDGLCETTLTVLGEMGAYPEMINQEVLRYLPFLTTTNFLSLATGAGIGREQAHEIIKGHAVAEALRMKKTGISINNLPRLLAEDPSFVQHGITREQIDAVLSNKGLVGNAEDQMLTVYGQINMLVNRFPKEAAYKPQEIL